MALNDAKNTVRLQSRKVRHSEPIVEGKSWFSKTPTMIRLSHGDVRASAFCVL